MSEYSHITIHTKICAITGCIQQTVDVKWQSNLEEFLQDCDIPFPTISEHMLLLQELQQLHRNVNAKVTDKVKEQSSFS